MHQREAFVNLEQLDWMIPWYFEGILTLSSSSYSAEFLLHFPIELEFVSCGAGAYEQQSSCLPCHYSLCNKSVASCSWVGFLNVMMRMEWGLE